MKSKSNIIFIVLLALLLVAAVTLCVVDCNYHAQTDELRHEVIALYDEVNALRLKVAQIEEYNQENPRTSFSYKSDVIEKNVENDYDDSEILARLDAVEKLAQRNENTCYELYGIKETIICEYIYDLQDRVKALEASG